MSHSRPNAKSDVPGPTSRVYILARNYVEADFVAHAEHLHRSKWEFVREAHQLRGINGNDAEIWAYGSWYEMWPSAATIELRYRLQQLEEQGCEVVHIGYDHYRNRDGR